KVAGVTTAGPNTGTAAFTDCAPCEVIAPVTVVRLMPADNVPDATVITPAVPGVPPVITNALATLSKVTASGPPLIAEADTVCAPPLVMYVPACPVPVPKAVMVVPAAVVP